MKYKVITPPAALLTLAELREHLRVDDLSASQDNLMLQSLESAREYCQHYTGRAIGSQTIEIALDAFPESAIELAPGPATSIASVKYIDVAGVEQTFPPSLVKLDDYGMQHWALRASVAAWPATFDAANVVKVRYVAGSLPAAVMAALLLLVAHYYENREAVVPSRFITSVPYGVNDLLDTVKVWTV